MPWIEESVMSQRLRVVEQMILPGCNVKDLCHKHGISRKTAYKWLQRYKDGGVDDLKDAPRIPHKQPNKTSDIIEAIVLTAHREYPYWGPFKLQHYLINCGHNDVPSDRTIGRILKRNNCNVIKNNKSLPATMRFERRQANDLWQMDFKGSFMTRVSRCYPLTILDDCSRYSLCLQACPNETGFVVKEQLIRVFSEFGMPIQINVDNGNPWGNCDLESVTSLQVWLMKCGIRLSHSAPYHPQTNGKDERFHRSLKLEVLHHKQYRDFSHVQKEFDRWRNIYNYTRPHQGINNKPPCSRYTASLRKYSGEDMNFEYDHDEIVRKVTSNGMIAYSGRKYRVGKGFIGEYIALKETNTPDVLAIFFMDNFIKKINVGEHA